MRTIFFIVAPLFAVWLTGCSFKAGRPVLDLHTPEIATADTQTPSIAVDAGPSPELSRAVERGEARPAGPVTDDRFRRWWNRAELLVLIESQKGHIRYLREWLKLADESEQKFLDRIGLEPLYTGESAAQQLKTFQLVRRRVTRELDGAEARLAGVQHNLAQLDSQSKEKNSIALLSGDHVMENQPLSSLGLSNAQAQCLAERGIRNVGELARDFYLPEQHELLAQLLEMDLESARRLLQQATASIPETELNVMIDEARRPRSFGVLPPAERTERSKP